MNALADNVVLRRILALVLLALALVTVLPILAAPVQSWIAANEAISGERRILERITRLDARRAAVIAEANAPNARFLIAGDRADAERRLEGRLRLAVPEGAVRLGSVTPAPPTPEDEARPGQAVRLLVSFEATQSGLYALLRHLEGEAPLVRTVSLDAVPKPGGDRPLVLAGHLEVAAAFLLRQEGTP